MIGEAPGRVNLIGEHTDYSGGFVLPTVIPQTTAVAVAANADAASRAWSASVPHDQQQARFVVGEEARAGTWVDYVQGATAVLRAAGHQVGGFDAVIRSEVPLGSGLSSSASLSVAVLRALRDLFQLQIDDSVLAGLARRIETDFIGVPVGVMDPIACALGAANHALFLDTRDLSWQLVRIPSTAEFAVINSGHQPQHRDRQLSGAPRRNATRPRGRWASASCATSRDREAAPRGTAGAAAEARPPRHHREQPRGRRRRGAAQARHRPLRRADGRVARLAA